jgi:7-cyano-7-deazaguanine reductase
MFDGVFMKNNFPVFDKVMTSVLKTMPYEYSGKDINVRIETGEFTCLCPWTALPDFAYVIINYTPTKSVVEFKSLKFYLQSYRMVGMIHESVANNILSDLVKTVKPKEMCVNMKFGIRGGLTVTVSAEYLNRETKEKNECNVKSAQSAKCYPEQSKSIQIDGYKMMREGK